MKICLKKKNLSFLRSSSGSNLQTILPEVDFFRAVKYTTGEVVFLQGKK